MRLLRRLRDDDRSRGAVLVETAMLTPLLILLLLGIVDFGRALATKIAIVEATEEGALFAAYNPTSYMVIQTHVVESLDAPTILAMDVAVTCPNSTDIKVTVSHDFTLITPIISNIFGPMITLTGEVTATKFGSGACDPSPP